LIISISGWQRSGKDLVGAILAKYELTDYKIEQGYGNCSLYNMPYPYEKMTSRQLLDRIFYTFNNGEEHKMFLISEAHRILNPRMWKQWTKEDTYNLAGIFQDDKQDNVIIYNFHPGKPGDDLLGVDKMVRAATFFEIEILTDKQFVIEHDAIMLQATRYFMNQKVVTKSVIEDVSQYFSLFDTKEPVT